MELCLHAPTMSWAITGLPAHWFLSDLHTVLTLFTHHCQHLISLVPSGSAHVHPLPDSSSHSCLGISPMSPLLGYLTPPPATRTLWNSPFLFTVWSCLPRVLLCRGQWWWEQHTSPPAWDVARSCSSWDSNSHLLLLHLGHRTPTSLGGDFTTAGTCFPRYKQHWTESCLPTPLGILPYPYKLQQWH